MSDAKPTSESKSTVQVRIPVEVASDASRVASAFGEQPNEYITRVIEAAVAADFPEAERIIKERAKVLAGRKVKLRKPPKDAD